MLLQIIFGEFTVQEKFIIIVAYIVAIYFAVVLHEIGHGFVAHLNGDDTAKVNGRLSLNPVKHFDPLGMAMMLLIGMGWARPVPVDSRNFRSERKGMVTVALAGVTVNLILSFLGFALYVGMGAILQKAEMTSEILIVIVKLFFYIGYLSTFLNISLIAFNLLPIFPLDGFRLIEAFTKPDNKFVVFMRKYSRYLFLVLIMLDIIGDRTGWPCNILSMYIGLVQDGITKLYSLIFGL